MMWIYIQRNARTHTHKAIEDNKFSSNFAFIHVISKCDESMEKKTVD